MSDAKLYVVATPIGNLGDITKRAVEVLQSVALIAAEDTRHSARLLGHLGISAATISVHDHNERQRVQTILDKLAKGESVALVSDAGTPLISDPGFVLVREVKTAGYKVVPIPGCCAFVTALSAAGVASDRFAFEGFLSAKSGARKQALTALAEESRSLIFYESTHRIVDSLKDMQHCFGDERVVAIARELTKTFETIHTAPLAELIEWIEADSNQQRGEFVVIVSGYVAPDNQELDAQALKILNVLREELPLKQAAALAAKISGEKKNALYKWALAQDSE